MTGCDHLIIGAGAAGCAAAFVLARAGLDVRMVDRRPPASGQRVGECLSGQGVHLLRRTGLIDWAEASHPLDNPGDLSCWESAELRAKDFLFAPWGAGWHLDRMAFDATLRQAATAQGVRLHEGHVRSIARSGGRWIVETDGDVFSARHIVDASGRAGFLARHLGLQRLRDAPLIAVYSWGENRCEDARTVVEAVPGGWWYTAPTPGGRRVAAIHVTPRRAQELLRRPQAFALALRRTLHLKAFCSIDGTWERPRATDASGSCLEIARGEDWQAIGDAAMTFDPLSSHGLLNALAHGVYGAKAMAAGDVAALAALDGQIRAKRQRYLGDIASLYASRRRWTDKEERDYFADDD